MITIVAVKSLQNVPIRKENLPSSACLLISKKKKYGKVFCCMSGITTRNFEFRLQNVYPPNLRNNILKIN